MLRRLLIAATFAIALIILFVLAGGAFGPETPLENSQVQPHAKRQPPILESPVLAWAARREAIQSAQQAGTKHSGDEDADDSEPEFGYVVGKVYDYDGTPIPKAVLIFTQGIGLGGDFGGSTHSDDLGDYRQELPAGRWQVMFAGRSSDSIYLDPGMAIIGEVEIVTEREPLFDVALMGTRALRGGFYRPDLTVEEEENGGILHEVELRLSSDPDWVVAQAFAGTSPKDKAEYLEYLENGWDEDNVQLPKAKYPPGMGYFEMEGLPPDHYELRVYLDVERKFFITMQVDLTEGDLEFAPIPVTPDQFLDHEELTLY